MEQLAGPYACGLDFLVYCFPFIRNVFRFKYGLRFMVLDPCVPESVALRFATFQNEVICISLIIVFIGGANTQVASAKNETTFLCKVALVGEKLDDGYSQKDLLGVIGAVCQNGPMLRRLSQAWNTLTSTPAAWAFVQEDAKKKNVTERLIINEDLVLSKSMKDLDNIWSEHRGNRKTVHDLQGQCLEFMYRSCSNGMDVPLCLFPIPIQLKKADWREPWTKAIGLSSSKKLRLNCAWNDIH